MAGAVRHPEKSDNVVAATRARAMRYTVCGERHPVAAMAGQGAKALRHTTNAAQRRAREGAIRWIFV